MRSSTLLTSALAMGALAKPLEKRLLVTEVDLDIVTITVFVTPGQVLPTQGGDALGYTHGQWWNEHHSHDRSRTTAALSSSSSSASSTSLAPVPTSQPVQEPSSVYTPPPAPPTSTLTPNPTTPTSTPIPTQEAVTSVPSTAPASTVAPSSTAAESSQAPVASGSAEYGVNHVSGDSQATLSSSSGQEYQNAVLWHHNRARANHGASNLEWSSDCEAEAMKAAEYCDFVHHTVDGQGQNLFTQSGATFSVTAGITDSWYKGEADVYTWWGQEPPHNATVPDELDMEYFHTYGHATQLLWKATTHVGCATIDCGSKMTVGGVSSDMNKYTVCNYSPPGNYPDQFGKNVAAPIASYEGFLWSD